MDFNIENFNINLSIGFWEVSTVSLFALIIYFIKNPAKFEKLVALIHKYLKIFFQFSEYKYIKFDLQGKINDYVSSISKKVGHLNNLKAKIVWIDENETAESFLNDGQVVLRMHKSDNQNRNIVNASMAFISHSLLKKAKSYLAKYQRESIDIYSCYDLLKNEKEGLLDQFVQDFLKEKLDDDSIRKFFSKYNDINKVGIYYPVFIQELTFLGEKVFLKGENRAVIHIEVKNLVRFLYNYSQRKINEKVLTEFNGEYCKFAIRIVGKQFKINKLGKRTYIKNLLKTSQDDIETMYLLGDKDNKSFIKSVANKCKERIGFEIFNQESYSAKIKDKEGNDFDVKSYMLVLRKKDVNTVHED